MKFSLRRTKKNAEVQEAVSEPTEIKIGYHYQEVFKGFNSDYLNYLYNMYDTESLRDRIQDTTKMIKVGAVVDVVSISVAVAGFVSGNSPISQAAQILGTLVTLEGSVVMMGLGQIHRSDYKKVLLKKLGRA